METVTFTCTAPGDILLWDPSDVSRITVSKITHNLNEPVISREVYTVTLTEFDNNTLTSTLSRVAVDGITVLCAHVTTTLVTIGTTTINVVGMFT